MTCIDAFMLFLPLQKVCDLRAKQLPTLRRCSRQATSVENPKTHLSQLLVRMQPANGSIDIGLATMDVLRRKTLCLAVIGC